MAAPKIKLHKLPPGYSEETDNDVQDQSDELIPVVAKPDLLTDATELEGVLPMAQHALTPIDPDSPRSSYNLETGGLETQTPQGTAMNNILWDVHGALAPIVKDSGGDVISPDDYSIDNNGFHFTIDPPPTSATVEVYDIVTSFPHNKWALKGDILYRGNNPSFHNFIVSVDSSVRQHHAKPSDGVGYITVSASSVVADYTIKLDKARHFVGDQENWVGGHLNMWPDIFVGEYDYPGDQTNIGGIPSEPGPVPKFVDPGEYQLDFRRGLVTFIEEVDSSVDTVKANVSHLAGVQNVTNQTLDAVSGSGNLRFKAESEVEFQGSHDKRWVNRNDQYLPINVYVDGELTPTFQTVAPHDEMTIKTS